MSEKRLTRRDAIKKAVYITPIILTLAALPSFASSGSEAGRGGRFVTFKGHRGWWLWRHRVRTRRFVPDKDP